MAFKVGDEVQIKKGDYSFEAEEGNIFIVISVKKSRIRNNEYLITVGKNSGLEIRVFTVVDWS